MSRRSQPQRNTPRSAGGGQRPRGALDRFELLFGLACAVLTLVRFLVPAESADEGDTLAIVVGWMALAVLVPWLAHRRGCFHWRPGWPEAAVLCLAIPQVLSSLALLATGGGNTRAALNMLWEWLGVAVAFLLLRVWCQDEQSRSRLRAILLSAGLLLSGLGVWQRFVWYPQIQSAYLEWLDLQAGHRGHGLEVERRMDELQRILGPQLLSLTGSSQAALKQRILDSQEPFGRFGLTNTFGGVLGIVLILLAGRRPGGHWPRWLLWGGAVSLVATTLILTRSRTAWLATLCGLVFLAVVRWRPANSGGCLRSLARQMALGGIALVPVIGLALACGAVDRQDLLEAPKSVLYRVQYWTGTWPVIREHPLLGVGPGNFRQHYLQYKLPEASEEISDPHNLVLDVWSSGGLVGLLGLLSVLSLATGLWRQVATGAAERHSSGDANHRPSDWRWLCITGWLTCALVFLAGYVFVNRMDRELLWLALAWGPVAFWVDRLLSNAEIAGIGGGSALAAGLALTIHLLTSGGIAMPVITLLWLTLIFILPAGQTRLTDAPAGGWYSRSPERFSAALSVAAATLLVGCLVSGWGPVTLAGIQISAGDTVLHVDHRPEEAADLYRQATESDPRNPETWQSLAFAEAALWQRGGRDAEKRFAAALGAVDQMIAADPANPHAYRVRGELWLQRYRKEQISDFAEHAAEAFQQAGDRYPNSALILAQLAQSLSAAGRIEEARAAAARALELDDLFIAAGHYDKVFSTAEREEMTALVSK